MPVVERNGDLKSPCARSGALRKRHAERVRVTRSQGKRGDSRAERSNLEELGDGDAGAAGEAV